MPIQPKAVIFDYGYVLCLRQDPAEVEGMAAILNTPVERFLEVYWPHRVAYDRADFSPSGYWEQVAADLARTLSPEQILALMEFDNRSWAHPDAVMIEWAAALRAAGIRTALLSNMPVPLRQYLDESCPWLPAFDHRTFSCDVRLLKPSPEIYTHTLEGLGVAPAEALFLDDREPNVTGARDVGMHAILFETPAQAAREIQDRFHVPVPLLAV